MVHYLLNRVGYGLLVLLLVTIVVSSIVYLSPVDPTRMTFGQRMDDVTVELKRKQLGLDLPFHLQVVGYIKDISPFIITSSNGWKDEYRGIYTRIGPSIIGLKYPYLRESYQSGRSVIQIIGQAFPNTLILASLSILLAIIMGISLGALAALFKGSWIDRFIIFISTFGYSVPSYVTAILLGVIFGYYLRDFTGLNIQGSFFELDDFGDDIVVFKNLLLPAIALGIRPVSIVAQLMRSSVIQVLEEKYILAARAKGLSAYQVIKNHVLGNALNPVITALSGWFASLLAGAFFVEIIFNFKGLGFVTVNALLNYDIPVVLGALLFTSTIFIIINILVDLLYTWIDPRITIKA
ncbi:MAG: ABC transporter permease [Saprospiraceae bacterium]|nr:ABC transporter permease [Saprospiraceae bacterium]